MGANYVIGISLSSAGVGLGTVMSNTMLSAQAELDDIESDEQEDQRPPEGERRSAKSLLRRQILGQKKGAPGISSVMMQSFNIIQDRIARSRLAGDPPDRLINPAIGDIGLFDFHRAADAIDVGYAAAQPIIKELLQADKAVAQTA